VYQSKEQQKEPQEHSRSTAEEPQKNTNKNLEVKELKKESKSSRFTPPTIEEAREYFLHLKAFDEAEAFYHYHNSKGWKVSGRPMVNWKSAISTWIQNDFKGNQASHRSAQGFSAAANGEYVPTELELRRLRIVEAHERNNGKL
jgi:hypothetical protein